MQPFRLYAPRLASMAAGSQATVSSTLLPPLFLVNKPQSMTGFRRQSPEQKTYVVGMTLKRRGRTTTPLHESGGGPPRQSLGFFYFFFIYCIPGGRKWKFGMKAWVEMVFSIAYGQSSFMILLY
ncbi:hypothetical protein Dimus_032719 [Dionaea muscipula]